MADEQLGHLFIAGHVKGIPFKAPGAVPKKPIYNRNVGEHGRRLLGQLDELAGTIGQLEAVRQALDLPLQRGGYAGVAQPLRGGDPGSGTAAHARSEPSARPPY